MTSLDTLSEADAIVVLGGDDSSFCRVQHALCLFDEGRASVVVFSGGTLKDTGLACSSAQLSLEAAQELGLPAGASIIADARDAQGNLLPDAERLTRFGRFLRSTSLDERNLAWQQ